MADMELESLIGKLTANEKVIGLVKIMQPMDIIAVITKDLDLCDEEAERVTKNLLQHVHNVHYEGMSSPAIETNKQFPVPSKLKKKKVDEYVNNFGALNPTMSQDHFPKPRPEDGEWPYDDMTQAIMDPKNKGKKRPLMQGPFDPDLRKNQPGGDGAGGKGIYSKNSPHNRDNSTPTSGASWDKKGTPGWSSSPPGKEFDLPGEENPPVGAPIPQFFGGHSQHRRMGFRRR